MTKSDGGDASSKEMWSELHVLAEVASVLYDELQQTKIVYEQDDGDQVARLNKVLDSVPRKPRSKTLRRNRSSSSLLLRLTNSENPLPSQPSSSISDYYTRKMVMKNPQNPSPSHPSSSGLSLTQIKNPNFQSSKTRKRRAVQETRKSKKAKIVHLSWKGREAPEWLLEIMQKMNVLEEPKLIFERTLYKTDVNPTQSRLSMPINQVIFDDFLTPEEVGILQQDINNEVKVGVESFLVNQGSKMWRAVLKRWESQRSWNYSVTLGWNDFVAANGFKEDTGISVWTFRWSGILCFAVIPPPED